MKAQFILPEFFFGVPIYGEFTKISKKYPDILYPNTEIYSIFGIFPGSIWNGGGFTTNGAVSRETIEEIIKFYNEELNVSLSFTFTNPILEEKHYYDTYSNLIAELGNNGKNIILVSDTKFESYLRKNYPNYRYVRSIIATENDFYSLESPYGKYDMSVLARRKNNDWEYLNSIPMEDRSKIEILCNERCINNCPNAYNHYRTMAEAQLQLKDRDSSELCQYQGIFSHKDMKDKSTSYISRSMIDEIYLPKGFNKFKCAGRFSQSSIILILLNYLIKPEYHDDLFKILLSSINVD